MAKLDDLTIVAVKSALQDFQPFSTNSHLQLPPVKSPKKSKKPILEKELNCVLVKVQDDIQKIKQNVLDKLSTGQSVDPDNIKALFEKAEKDIEEKKNEIVNQFCNRALTTPAFNIPEKGVVVRKFEDDEKPNNIGCKTQYGSGNRPSPGQKALALQKLKSIINPARYDGRALLKKHYNVPMPNENAVQLKKPESPRPTPVTGTTINQNTPVPKANRVSGRLTPPPPSSDDKRKGVMNLIERKIIPASSHLSICPSPVKHKPAKLHQPLDMKQYKQNLAMARLKPQYNLALVKLDETTFRRAIDPGCKRGKTQTGDSFNPLLQPHVKQVAGNVALYDSTVSCTQQTTGASCSSRQIPTTAVEANRIKGSRISPLPFELTESISHPFSIQNGHTCTTSQDFVLFKQYYCLSWGSIASLLQRLERLLTDYSIPEAFVNGDRLADLSMFFEVGPKPTIKDLLMCVINNEEVERMIVIPGRRYKASDGEDRAAIKIQSTWKCYTIRSSYLTSRRNKWAAGMIALTWIMKCKMSMIRLHLKENNAYFLQQFRERAKTFKQSWKKIQNRKRLILHVPSLGYPSTVREKLDNIALLQNSQIGRISDLKDPNVEVLYISPVKLTDDLLHYYHKLIEVMANVHNLDADDVKSRLKILTPENCDRFPEHNLCLASLFKYSITLTRRVKSILKGKTAYMIPGMMSNDDLYLAQQFDIPILGSEPEVAQLYSMKSGVCRIFESAGVNTPPCSFDIYSPAQMYQKLAKLVTENLNVTRWLFKIDDQFNGRGTAYCDVALYLSSYESARKEQEKYGDKWKKKWVNESKYNAILIEIPKILRENSVALDATLYPTWLDFLTDFCKRGGVIEAAPPSESVTGITANVLIEPDGNVKILTVADQIHATSPYKCWGHTLPQSSIEPTVINKAIHSINVACKDRGIIGYISVDFVTFIDPESEAQQLWAVGLNIAYSSSYAMAQLMEFLTGGYYDNRENTLTVTVNRRLHSNVAYRSKRERSTPYQDEIIEDSTRYCVMSANLFHTNLNHIYSNVFFHMCKSHCIGYDDKMKLGTSFTLLDQIHREQIGMIYLGDSLYNAVWNFAYNLQIIHDDISSPTMQGKSNFEGAIKEMKAILRSSQVNSEIDQNLYPTLDPMRHIASAGSTHAQGNFNSKTRKCKSLEVVRTTGVDDTVPDREETPPDTFILPINSSTETDYLDNRFPSSPVTDDGKYLN